MPNLTSILPQVTYAYTTGLMEYFQDSAVKHGVPVHILLAVASRETGIGTAEQFQMYKGDFGNGKGIMQIDQRWHSDFTSTYAPNDHKANIEYGTSLLAQNLKANSGDWRKAIAAYNAGQGNVNKAVRENRNVDYYTTGQDYSKDVLDRSVIIDSIINPTVQKSPFLFLSLAAIAVITVTHFITRK